MTARTRIRMAAVALALLAAVGGAGVWWLVSTESGLRSAVSFVLNRSAPNVTVGRVTGRLRGPMTFHDIRYAGVATTAHVDSVRVGWRLWPLLSRRLMVRTLDVGAVEVSVRTVSPDTNPTPFPPQRVLPVRLDVATSTFGPIRITRDSLVVRMDGTRLLGLRGRDSISIDAFESTVNGTEVSLAAHLELVGPYPFTVTGAWEHLRDTTTYAGRGAIRGNLDTLFVEHALARPIVASIDGRVDDPRGSGRLQLRIDVPAFDLVSLAPDAPPTRVAIRGTASGTFDALAGDLTLSASSERTGPVQSIIAARVADGIVVLDSVLAVFPGRRGSIRATGTAHLPPDSIFDVTLTWSRLGLPLTDPVARFTSSGQGQVAGTLEQYRFTTSGTVIGRRGGPQRFTASGRGTHDASQLRATARGAAGTVSATGRVTWRPDVRWAGSIRGDSVDPTPFLRDSASVVNAIRFVATTAGRWSEQLRGTFRVDEGGAEVTDVPIRFAGAAHFVGSRLTIDSTRIRGLGGEMDLRGEVTWAEGSQWDLRASIHGFRPESVPGLVEQWNGSLDAAARTHGSITAEALAMTVTMDTVFGTVRAAPVGGRGTVSWFRDSLDVHDVSLAWGPSWLRANGSLREQLDLRIALEVTDLGIPLPGGAGTGTADIALGGTRDVPTLVADVRADNVGYQDIHFGHLTTTARMDLGPAGPFQLQADVRQASRGNLATDTLVVVVDGVRENHTVRLTSFHPAGTLRVAATGSATPDTWSGIVTGLLGAHATLGTWDLTDSASVFLTRDSVRVEQLCLRDGDQSACGRGIATRAGAWRVAVDARDIALSPWAAYANVPISVRGPVHATAALSAHQTGGLDGQTRIWAASRDGIRIASPTRTVVLDSPVVDAHIGDGGVASTLSARARDATVSDSTWADIRGTLHLPGYRSLSDSISSQRFVARVRADVPDLAVFDVASRRIANTAGTLALDVTATGTRDRFDVRGSGTVRNFATDLPALGISLREGELQAEGDDAGLALTGRVVSGAGELRLTGRLGRAGPTDTALAVRITGDNVETFATPEITARTNPDLLVTLADGVIAMDGVLTVPFASVELREFPTTLGPTRDVVFVGDATPAQRSRLTFRNRVRIVLGDSISFRGFGLTANPRGTMSIQEEPGRARTATGLLSVEGGRYRAYGQELTIETGRLIYAGGPVGNPGIEVRATRRIAADTLAGITVRGTLREPLVSVFSEPAMLQGDALAYLMFGRPVQDISLGERSTLTNAARSLGVARGNVLTQRLGRRLGLDEARIDASGTWQEASFVAGKYLSPRLFVSYTVGLFEPRDIFHLRYALSRKWTLQAETGDGTATDIRYRLERSR